MPWGEPREEAIPEALKQTRSGLVLKWEVQDIKAEKNPPVRTPSFFSFTSSWIYSILAMKDG